MALNYDLVVLGGGTGGYVTAIRAAQLGLKTAVVEKEKLGGGTCLHKGCIPTKALLKSASVFQLVKEADRYGVEVEKPLFQITKAIERKNKIVDSLYEGGVNHLIKSHNIDVYHGFGRILGPSIFSPMAGSISVEYDSEKENDILIPKNVIIATGTFPSILPGVNVDHQHIVTSDDLVEISELPQSIIIVGGGVIGIEWASFLHDVGVKVTIIEAQESILPSFDKDIINTMRKNLVKKGITIIENANLDIDSITTDNKIQLTYKLNNQTHSLSAEKLLLSVGRKANTRNIGLENTEIVINDKGFISVNEHFQTKESHIYAIGDVNGGKQLAHVATYEGKKAVEHIADITMSSLSENEIPSCVYGNPEIAMIGLTETEVQHHGFDYQTTITSFKAIGKAHVNGQTDGFIKIIIDKNTEDILGIHMIGSQVTELIGQASTAKYFDSSALELSEVSYPHPSLSEIIGEAALAAEGGRKIHG
ncbi:dihydrolipoamide dehydrogenase of branched-chain alpha-keto acid dehydrogenase [Gracilibacillus boraciitolerans JCM 21714]|uniref:Dihydrolipoyl dehydrogenase n=1 Tax=Gracilibacillus boraciitolerans JCM 21714 TaxID=1298598 RepID=W4VDI2_9BACI|nr:dihydrolipoyl dehydrogenase [Gracilibacillus boraciitolerans]GAE91272.1 dihydrolipoamide dehydrogenase of branched-chain alpha-keto acid dehydrogenase [Gracilibacillus boraciitolerans JCM 21714]